MLVGHGRAASAILRFQYRAPHIWDSANSQVRPVGEPYQVAATAITSRAAKTNALMMERRRQCAHANDVNVRRASFSNGRLPRPSSIARKISTDKTSGRGAEQPSWAHAEARSLAATGPQ